MAGVKAARVAHPAILARHPELVSGPIVPHAQPLSQKRNGAFSWSRQEPGLQAKWVLKRVQDDVGLEVGL